MDKVIVHVEQRFKTMGRLKFVELLNSKLFMLTKRIFRQKHFQLGFLYKNILDLDGLKRELKSAYTADFAKQVSII